MRYLHGRVDVSSTYLYKTRQIDSGGVSGKNCSVRMCDNACHPRAIYSSKRLVGPRRLRRRIVTHRHPSSHCVCLPRPAKQSVCVWPTKCSERTVSPMAVTGVRVALVFGVCQRPMNPGTKLGVRHVWLPVFVLLL